MTSLLLLIWNRTLCFKDSRPVRPCCKEGMFNKNYENFGSKLLFQLIHYERSGVLRMPTAMIQLVYITAAPKRGFAFPPKLKKEQSGGTTFEIRG